MGRRTRQRTTLQGWVKWLPFVLLPFGVLFSETWMRTQQVQMDYETNRINASMRRLDEQMNDLRVEEAKLDNMDRMQAHAPSLGLVEPTHEQIQVVAVEDSGLVEGVERPMALAQGPLAFMDEGEVD